MAPSRPKDERRSNVGEDQNSRVSIRASCHSQPDLKTTFKLLSDQTLAPLRHTKAHSALRDLKNVPVEDFLATHFIFSYKAQVNDDCPYPNFPAVLDVDFKGKL